MIIGGGYTVHKWSLISSEVLINILIVLLKEAET